MKTTFTTKGRAEFSILTSLLLLSFASEGQYIAPSGAGAPNGNQYYLNLANQLKAKAAAEEAAQGGQHGTTQPQASPIQSVQQNYANQQQNWQNVGNQINQILQRNNQNNQQNGQTYDQNYNGSQDQNTPWDNSNGAGQQQSPNWQPTQVDPSTFQQPHYAAEEMQTLSHDQQTYGGLYPDINSSPDAWVRGDNWAKYTPNSTGSDPTSKGSGNSIDTLANQLIDDDTASTTPSVIVFPGPNSADSGYAIMPNGQKVFNATTPAVVFPGNGVQNAPNPSPSSDQQGNGVVTPSSANLNTVQNPQQSETSPNSRPPYQESGDATANANEGRSVSPVQPNSAAPKTTALNEADQLANNASDPIEPAMNAVSQSNADETAKYNAQAASLVGTWMTFDKSKITDRYQNFMNTQITTPVKQIVDPNISNSADSLTQ